MPCCKGSTAARRASGRCICKRMTFGGAAAATAQLTISYSEKTADFLPCGSRAMRVISSSRAST